MDDRTFKETLERAIHKYGDMMQMRQCIEEMAELTQAISKYQRAYSEEEVEKAIDNLIEEIADVHIMVQQMIMIIMRLFSDEGRGRINDQIEYKVNRLRERIENE